MKTDAITPDFSSETLVDQDVISMLRDLSSDDDDGAAFLRDLIETYLEIAPGIVQDLKVALLNHDIKSIEHLAHRLKGCSRNLGLRRISHICESIEHEIRGGGISQAKLFYEPLSHGFHDTRHAVEKLRESCVIE